MLASVTVVENGRSQRVPLIREDDYRATYAPLISLISEKCTNDDSIDLALGRADGRASLRHRADLRAAQHAAARGTCARW